MTTITAAWADSRGCDCPKCRTARAVYHAALNDREREQIVTIDEAAWNALRARAGNDDYRDGSYIGFDQPLRWIDVFTDARGL